MRFSRTPVVTRLERQHEQDQATWRAQIRRENAAQDKAVHMHGTAFWSGSAKDLAAQSRARDELESIRDEGRALGVRWQARDVRALAHLGNRGGTLHELLREQDREEQRGEHAFKGSGWRQLAPAETWLDRFWHDIKQQHPDLTHGDTGKSTDSILKAIGARRGDARARGWVEQRLQDDRDFEAAIEREREEWFAEQGREEYITDHGTEPEGDEPAAQEPAAAPDAEAEL